MDKGKCQKKSKEFSVSAADASADPWAMMVVDFNADIALVTVEGPWRSYSIAGIAVRED